MYPRYKRVMTNDDTREMDLNNNQYHPSSTFLLVVTMIGKYDWNKIMMI